MKEMNLTTNPTEYNNHNKKYIYNVKFANSVMQSGIRCIETGFNAKSQSFYWAFLRDEIQPFYDALMAEANK